MFYASYSKGVLPGKANDAVANATDRELAQYKATQPNVARFLKEEELDSIEFGWKGTVGRVNLAVAVYQADWEKLGRSRLNQAPSSSLLDRRRLRVRYL